MRPRRCVGSECVGTAAIAARSSGRPDGKQAGLRIGPDLGRCSSCRELLHGDARFALVVPTNSYTVERLQTLHRPSKNSRFSRAVELQAAGTALRHGPHVNRAGDGGVALWSEHPTCVLQLMIGLLLSE
eukprot:366129-Chlamydomonas_euryale.AAC.6